MPQKEFNESIQPFSDEMQQAYIVKPHNAGINKRGKFTRADCMLCEQYAVLQPLPIWRIAMKMSIAILKLVIW